MGKSYTPSTKLKVNNFEIALSNVTLTMNWIYEWDIYFVFFPINFHTIDHRLVIPETQIYMRSMIWA